MDIIRLSSSSTYKYYYELKDTETKNCLGRCAVVPEIYKGIEVLVIWSVRIYEKFQRKGFATLMLKRIIKKYQSDERPLLLHVFKDNEIAIHLYEKLGFEIIREYYNNAWTMQYKRK